MNGLTPEDALELAKKMRMDLTQLQARLSTLIEYIAADDRRAAPEYRCDHCGVTFASRMNLLDHAVLVHEDQAAEDEREAEWERLASLAVQTEPVRQGNFEEDPEQRRAIAEQMRARFQESVEARHGQRGAPEPPLAGTAEPALR